MHRSYQGGGGLLVQSTPTSFNNPMGNACRIWIGKFIVEEGRDCQSFLTACRAALQVCPPETHEVIMCPVQLVMGNMSLAALLTIPPSHPLP